MSALLWTFYHIGLMICALDALRRRSIGRATFVVCMHFFISLVVREGRPQPMPHNTGCSSTQGGRGAISRCFLACVGLWGDTCATVA